MLYSLEIANPRDPSIRDPLIRDPLNTDARIKVIKLRCHRTVVVWLHPKNEMLILAKLLSIIVLS